MARPEEKNESDGEKERSGDALKKANGVDAAKDDENVEEPEGEEAEGQAKREIFPDRNQSHEHGVDGFAADPGLNAEPAAGDKGAENGGDVCAEHAEGGAREDREWDAVGSARVSVKEHRDEDDDVAKEDRGDGLLAVHAAGNHSAGEHVGGNVDAHGDPERGVIVSGPVATRGRHGGEVLVVEGASAKGLRGGWLGRHVSPRQWRGPDQSGRGPTFPCA